MQPGAMRREVESYYVPSQAIESSSTAVVSAGEAAGFRSQVTICHRQETQSIILNKGPKHRSGMISA